MNDIVFATAQQLARRIRAREISAVEVLEAHLAQIARHNPSLNAIVTLDEEGARRRAREADAALARDEVWGPLHGVPVTIKDSFETAGVRTTSGHPPLAEYVPEHDATVVARVRAAGAVILGKTNLPELAGDFQTDNPVFGRTNNPWDRSRAVGGSTGGGAAALAAGMTPLEIGSDIGGSVRIPAHYCGVCALKPTDGRVSRAGHIPELPGAPRGVRHMGVMGPLARSVEDLALALRILAGPDGRDWEVPPAPLDAPAERPLGALRIAWTDDFGGAPVTGDTRAALAKLAGDLERLGCRVERRLPVALDFTTVWETWGELFEEEVGSTMSPEAEERRIAGYGFDVGSEVALQRGMARGVNATMRQFTATLMKRDAIIAAFERFFGDWDALLCPVTAGSAIPHCPPGTPIAVDEETVPYWTGGLAYTTPFNLTGHPVVVLPVACSAEGLPLGVQLVGPRWDEMALLAIAAQLAETVGPFPRPPGF